jgi:hypothetical protein
VRASDKRAVAFWSRPALSTRRLAALHAELA